MKVEIVPAEALVVGPDEVLLIKIKSDWLPEEVRDDFVEELRSVLGDRFLLIEVDEEIEFTKVQK